MAGPAAGAGPLTSTVASRRTVLPFVRGALLDPKTVPLHFSYLRVCILNKRFYVQQGIVIHTCNPNPREAEAEA